MHILFASISPHEKQYIVRKQLFLYWVESMFSQLIKQVGLYQKINLNRARANAHTNILNKIITCHIQDYGV